MRVPLVLAVAGALVAAQPERRTAKVVRPVVR
jgi:hypothetical protein